MIMAVSPNPYSVQIEQIRPDTVLVTLNGIFTTESAEPLQRQLLDQISPRASLIALDMSGIQFITSTAIGVLIALHRRMKRHGGGRLRMAGLRPPIEQIFRTLCLQHMVELYPTVTQALESPTDTPAQQR
jgi:anti-sigma B factor antagonist